MEGKAYQIAIVEDEEICLRQLEECLMRYRDSVQNVEFQITVYRDCEKFLEENKARFDIVFMDIDLPGMSGMECARRLRKTDETVALIFCTRLAQFAVEGYSVSAIDYIVKPVAYKNFSVKMNRILSSIDRSRDNYITVKGDQLYRLNVNEIVYVEVQGHRLTFHLFNGKEVTGWGVLKKTAEQLKGYGFGCCSSCYLVNFKYVATLNSTKVRMKDDVELNITRRSKVQFLSAFSEYLGYRGGG